MKIYKKDNEDIPAIKVQDNNEPSPSDYTEITTIDDLMSLGLGSTDISIPGWTDMICFRDKLKELVYTKMGVTSPEDIEDQNKWDLLSDLEKKASAEFFIVGRESFLLEVENDLRYWTVKSMEYRDWTQKVRFKRLEIMESIVFLRIQDICDAKIILADINQIAKDTVIEKDDLTKKLINPIRIKRMGRMYIEGLEDEENDGVVALRDYINETPGTPFQNGKGFRGLDCVFRTGHTASSVADELLDVMDGKF